MLKQSPENFRKFFLLEFTKEILRNIESYKKTLSEKREIAAITPQKQPKEFYVIPKIPLIKEKIQKKVIHEIVKEKARRDSEKISDLRKELSSIKFVQPKAFPEASKWVKRLTKPVEESRAELVRKGLVSPLVINELSLPPTVSHIRPVPMPHEIDLGKLNPYLKDPLVKVVECNGPDEKIIVMGRMGRKSTALVLTKEEIDDIIQRFSEATKIPVHEGINKFVFGRLVLSSIVSDVVGSKFIIKKMRAF